MRGFGTIVLAAFVSGFVAGTIQLQVAISYNAHEEFIAVQFGFVLYILVLALVFGVALIADAGKTMVNRIAVGFAIALVAGVGGLEAFFVWTDGQAALARDMPFLLEIIPPGLIAILIQWWFVHRHVKKKAVLAHG